MKRIFDIVVAFIGLVLLFPVCILVAVLVKLDSPGSIFFTQDRVGRGFRPFRIYKFRTMVEDAPTKGGRITAADDRRITRMGRFLRQSKIDEVPHGLRHRSEAILHVSEFLRHQKFPSPVPKRSGLP